MRPTWSGPLTERDSLAGARDLQGMMPKHNPRTPGSVGGASGEISLEMTQKL